MNNYVDYNYYKNTFNGQRINTEEDFESVSDRASAEIRARIMNRDITQFNTNVQNATCSVADALFEQQKIKDRIMSLSTGTEIQISSEKVGDYSRNISNASINDLKQLCSEEEIKKQIDRIAYNYLFFTGLLYRGL